MKAKYHIIYILAIVVLLAIILWPSKPDSDNAVIEQSIKRSELKIDSLALENTKLKTDREIKSKSIDSLTTIIQTLNRESITIEKEGNEKINRVDSYTANELQQYFADRYRK